jgi:hypothetical protein
VRIELGRERRRGAPVQLTLLAAALTAAIVVAIPGAGHSARPDAAASHPLEQMRALSGAPASASRAEHGWSAVPATARAPISMALAARDRAYSAIPARDGFVAASRPQRLRSHFGRYGVSIASGGSRLGLRTKGLGLPGTSIAVHGVRPIARANGVTYEHGGVREWYRNGPAGLEQGFTVARPGGGADGTLSVAMALSGNLRASLATDGSEVVLWRGRRQVLSYGDLWAVDAHGRTLPSRLALEGRTLRIVVDARDAAFPVRIDPLVQQARLSASDGADGDNFGYSVSVAADGSTLAVGAWGKEVAGEAKRGAVYVFSKMSGSWSQTATLTASDGVAGDRLGWSVALSADGSTLAAGAVNNDRPGKVYVFTRPGSGEWSGATQAAELTMSDAPANQNPGFGWSVAIAPDGSTVVAGAPALNFEGAVYVFSRAATGWADAARPATLTASDANLNGEFGAAVALSDDGSTILVGEFGANNGQPSSGTGSDPGALYVFSQPVGGWAVATETAKLTPSDAGGQLGRSVAVSPDGATVVGGAPGSTSSQGALYVYSRPGSTWTSGTNTARLVASDASNSDSLGVSVALAGDGSTIVGGAWGRDFSSGALYLYSRPASGTWTSSTETQELGARPSGQLGTSLATTADGSTVMSGAAMTNNYRGAVVVFGPEDLAPATPGAPTTPTDSGTTPADSATVSTTNGAGAAPVAPEATAPGAPAAPPAAPASSRRVHSYQIVFGPHRIRLPAVVRRGIGSRVLCKLGPCKIATTLKYGLRAIGGGRTTADGGHRVRVHTRLSREGKRHLRRLVRSRRHAVRLRLRIVLIDNGTRVERSGGFLVRARRHHRSGG